MARQLSPATAVALPTAAPEIPKAAERRATARFTSERVKLTFLGADHIPHNWSIDGVLVDDRHPNIEMDGVVVGILSAMAYFDFQRKSCGGMGAPKRTGTSLLKPFSGAHGAVGQRVAISCARAE
jgi:hypothetical protein